MYLNEVIPLLNLPRSQPQILSYFSTEKHNFGTLANIQVGKAKTFGLIINSQLIADKISIKKAGFNFKPLGTIANTHQIITMEQWELIKWLAEYYFLPLAGLLKIALPNKIVLKKIGVENNESIISKKVKNNQFILGDDYIFIKKVITECLKNKKQVLLVFPNQVKLEIYQDKFKDLEKEMIIFDKQSSQKQFLLAYKQINSQEKNIILGKRSSIFAPFSNLGLIVVVDEENSALETWEPEIHFNAKNACLKLNELFQAKIIFTSANPSLESHYLIEKGIFSLNGKFADISSRLHLIDSRKKLSSIILDAEVVREMEKSLQEKKQVIIFSNRRGFSPALICNDCGYVFQCPHCEVAMTHYQWSGINEMRCRHCGYKANPIDLCPQCQSHLINFVGIGNQKIAEFCQKAFPNYKIEMFDSDSLKSLKNERALFAKFENKEINILIVTELFSKWLDKIYNKLGLSIIMSAEQMTVFPDFRSEERLKNIIFKLAAVSEKVFIQTLNPEKELFENIKNLDKFYENELKLRRDLFYPPYSEIIKISIKHKNKTQLTRISTYYYQLLKQYSHKLLENGDYQILPPLPGFTPKIRNLFVNEIFLKIKPGHIKERNKIINFLPDDVSIKINPINIT
jgi:primosomal protein N' (replication factor Y)